MNNNRLTKCVLPDRIDKNLSDAMVLMSDYAGEVSETTAIMQYMYQYYTAGIINEQIAEVFEDIALVEMGHHELLGKAIARLGGDPVIGADYRYWNGGYVDYTRDLKKMILSDIKGEEAAIAGYKKSILHIETPSIKEMLKCIIEEENEHIALLNELLNAVKDG